MDKLIEARRVFNIEIEALEKMRDALNDDFVRIIDAVTSCNGKVIVTGMGKSGHIAAKMAATFASLGTSSFYLHPGEAMHGDLGMIDSDDVVIAISYSGESDEVIRILPNIRIIGAKVIGMTGNRNSSLARMSDMVQILPEISEACHLGLAPTSSTTVTMCYGDALAVVASELHGFKDSDFGMFHPAGTLGKRLAIKVEDLMAKGKENAKIHIEASLKDAIIELSKKGLGVVSIVDDEDYLLGIITDGDLRRQLENGVDIYALQVQDVMTHHPVTTEIHTLAIEALGLLKKKNISCLPIVERGKSVGTVRLQDIVGVGIVG